MADDSKMVERKMADSKKGVKMADSDEYNFIRSISQQLIFKTFLSRAGGDEPSGYISTNKIVGRNNMELFFANGNVVRCCCISAEHHSYRLLNNPCNDFAIRALEMNRLGTLLAVIGDDEVVVLTLPSSITTTDTTSIPVRAYRLGGISGRGQRVKKVCWQLVVSNDCCLVVLTDDNVIRLYDLSVSPTMPQLTLDLNKESGFQGLSAQSVTFGGDKSVAGSLTLYVSTTTSEIFAVFPFVSKLSKLSVSKEMVGEFVAELAQLIDVMDSEDSSACLKQYQYACSLGKQIDSPVPPRKELRNLFAKLPVELYVLEQSQEEELEISVQGPLYKAHETNCDIISLDNTHSTSILVSIGIDDFGSVHVTYLAQLKPLIMSWGENVNEIPLKQTAQTNGTSKKNRDSEKVQVDEYIKPKKGFGFIDSSELLSDDDEQNVSLPSQTTSNPVSERKPRSNCQAKFKHINVLALDHIPLTVKDDIRFSLVALNTKDTFFIAAGTKLIAVSYEEMLEQLEESILTGKVQHNNFSNQYKLIFSEDVRIESFFSVNDEVTDTGSYVAAIKRNENRDLLIKQFIKSGLEINVETRKEVKKPDAISSTVQSVLKQEPFEDLAKELERLAAYNKPNHSNFPSADASLFNKSVLCFDDSILRNLSFLSAKTIKQISNLTIYATHLNLRILAQIDETATQIETLDSLKTYEPSQLQSNIDKTEQLVARQAKLSDRINLLQQKVTKAVHSISYKRNLALSDAEKAWFKELNTITALVKIDTPERKSLSSSIKDLSAQALEAVESVKQKQSTSRPDDKLKLYQINQKTSKVKQWVAEEDDLITFVKNKLEETLKLV